MFRAHRGLSGVVSGADPGEGGSRGDRLQGGRIQGERIQGRQAAGREDLGGEDPGRAGREDPGGERPLTSAVRAGVPRVLLGPLWVSGFIKSAEEF